eukprot:COSAG01_NODE_30196_length_620_cov_221.765835_2_plen_72_part_00
MESAEAAAMQWKYGAIEPVATCVRGLASQNSGGALERRERETEREQETERSARSKSPHHPCYNSRPYGTGG